MRAAAVTLSLLLASCHAEDGVDDAVALAAPHLDTFVRFARWAGQTSRSDVVVRGDAALAETTFAPLRSDEHVVIAHVHGRVRGRAVELSMPESASMPAPPKWVSVRNAELGTLRVASYAECPVRARRAKEPHGCVLLQTGPVAANTDGLTIELAFRTGE